MDPVEVLNEAFGYPIKVSTQELAEEHTLLAGVCQNCSSEQADEEWEVVVAHSRVFCSMRCFYRHRAAWRAAHLPCVE